MSEKDILKRLKDLYKRSKSIPIGPNDKLVIFSDLHMGDGSKKDDLIHNGKMMQTLLQDFYDANHYTLLLNGDIEELLRYSMTSIMKRWKKLYRIFHRFHKNKRLIKLFGNHDYELHKSGKSHSSDLPVDEAVTLKHKSGDLLIFHGHQAGKIVNDFMGGLVGFILKYIATPLGITNYSVAHDNRTRYTIEKRVYDFARSQKLIAMIGHTHRPLFESLSKVDSLKYKIEHLCRKYPPHSPKEKTKLERRIKKYKYELEELLKRKDGNHSSLYQSGPLVPCIFNSGCTVGKSGVTAMEIRDNMIQLVYWFDERKSRKYFDFNGYTPEKMGETDYYRVVLNQEPLDYIFARIKLLA